MEWASWEIRMGQQFPPSFEVFKKELDDFGYFVEAFLVRYGLDYMASQIPSNTKILWFSDT